MLTNEEKYRVAFLAITQLGTIAARIAKQLQYGVVKQSQIDAGMDLTRMLNSIHLGFPETVLNSAQERVIYTNTERLASASDIPVAPNESNPNNIPYYHTPIDFFFTATISGTKLQELSNYNILVYRDPTSPNV